MHASVPPLDVNVTVAVLVVTVDPSAFCSVTTGCCAQTAPLAPPPGCVVKASFGTTTMAELTPDVSPVLAAVNVYVPALSMLQPVNGATPLDATTVNVDVQASVTPAGAPVCLKA